MGETNISSELIAKVIQAKTVQEVLELAKENGTELSQEQAQAYYDQFHKTGELDDEELDNVSGGGCYGNGGKMMVSLAHNCDFWQHKKCGGGLESDGVTYCSKCGEGFANCGNCSYCIYEKAAWWCTNPANAKK